MKKFARIYNGVVAELFETDSNIADIFHPSMLWVDVTGETIPVQVGFLAVYNSGAWSFSAPVQDAYELWKSYQQSAQAELDKSDVTVLRCVENGIAVPSEWATYRQDLRAIVSASNGDPAQPFPTRPPYPSGT